MQLRILLLLILFQCRCVDAINHQLTTFSYNALNNRNSHFYKSYFLGTCQDQVTETINVLMQPSYLEQQWSHYAKQLTAYDRMPVFEANQRSLHANIEYPISLLNEFCPFKLESSSFFHRRWDNLLDLMQGTHQANQNPNIARMVESVIAFCTISFTQPELQNILLTLQTDLKPLLFDNQGNIKLYLTSEEFRKYEAIKNTYIQAIAQWYCYHGIEQCAKDALNLDYPYYPSGIPNPRAYLKTDGPLAQPFSDLRNKPAFKDLCELKNLCNSGNFEQASQLVEKYAKDPEGLRSIGNKNYFTEYYLKKFYDKHDQRGIDKRYLTDHFCKTISGNSYKPSIYNAKLAERDGIKNQIIRNCKMYNPSEHTLGIIYEVIDLYENPKSVIDYLCTNLSADHPDHQVRASYHDFFDSGRIKSFGPQAITTHHMPDAINKAEFASERALLNKLILDHNDHQKINQFIGSLQNACNNSGQAHLWRSFAHILGKAILEGKEHIVAIIPDFSIAVKPDQEPIKIKTMNLALSIGHPEIGTQNYKRLSKIFNEYTSASHGDEHSQMFLEKFFLNGPNDVLLDSVLVAECHNIDPSLKSVNRDQMVSVIKGFEQLQQHKARIVRFHESLNPTAKMHCVAHNIPHERYEQFEGNPLQFEIFKIDRKNVEKAAELFAREMSPTLRRVYEWGVQSNFLTHSFIKAREYVYAIDLTTLAYKTFYYVDKACDYADYVLNRTLEGVIDGFQEMPERLQALAKELLAQAQNNLKEFSSLPLSIQQNGTTKYLSNIKGYVQNPISIGKDIWSCCKTLTNKAISLASNIYQMGPRKVAKNVTQFGIETYILRKAERIMQQGTQALAAEIQSMNQSPNPLTKPQKAERIIIDAEITQIETTAASIENKSWNLPEVSPLAKVESQASKIIQPRSTKISALTTNALQKAGLETKIGPPAALISQSEEILSPANAALVKNFNPGNYNPEIINVDNLSKAVEMFAYTKGALDKDGPLKRIIENAIISCEQFPGKAGLIRGAWYELETAMVLVEKGDKIIAFGTKLPLRDLSSNKIIKTLDIDIITKTNKFLECKNYHWNRFTHEQINKLQSSIKELSNLAIQNNAIFELHSKNALPLQLKNWLNKNKIIFFEG